MRHWKLLRFSGEESIMSDPREILAELEILASSNEPTADLISESGDYLTISISGTFALIIFHQASLDPPYLSPVVAPQGIVPEEAHVESTIGGTPTPVSRNRCVSIATMLEIVRHYLERGKLPSWVEWENQ